MNYSSNFIFQNLFLFCVEVALLYLIALMSNYKVKAAFLLFNINFKERKSFNSSYLNIKIGNIQHLADIVSLVAGQSPPLSKLNIILIYFHQNIVGGLALSP